MRPFFSHDRKESSPSDKNSFFRCVAKVPEYLGTTTAKVRHRGPQNLVNSASKLHDRRGFVPNKMRQLSSVPDTRRLRLKGLNDERKRGVR